MVCGGWFAGPLGVVGLGDGVEVGGFGSDVGGTCVGGEVAVGVGLGGEVEVGVGVNGTTAVGVEVDGMIEVGVGIGEAVDVGVDGSGDGVTGMSADVGVEVTVDGITGTGVGDAGAITTTVAGTGVGEASSDDGCDDILGNRAIAIEPASGATFWAESESSSEIISAMMRSRSNGAKAIDKPMP